MDSDDWYGRWAAYHGAMFGMDRDRDSETFAAWRDVFVLLGVTEEELIEATRWIACQPTAPQWRDKHLDAIKERIRVRRREYRDELRRQHSPEHSNEKGICEACRGTGFAVVPHPKGVVDGEWVAPFYTAGVSCSCYLGVRVKESNDQVALKLSRNMLLLTLAEYAKQFPHWREMLEWKEKRHRVEHRARQISKIHDKEQGELKVKKPSERSQLAEPVTMSGVIEESLVRIRKDQDVSTVPF